jgi:phenylalanyl-tRNA synthetase alpha chain
MLKAYYNALTKIKSPMKNLAQHLETIVQEKTTAIKAIQSCQDVENVRIAFCGRKGHIAHLMEQLKDLPIDEKKIYGPRINQLKTDIQQELDALLHTISQEEIAKKNAQQKNFDVTAYRLKELKGTTHIYTQIIEDLENVFISMGYDIIDGPEAENEYNNFEALNIPAHHPAREEEDSFYLKMPGMLLRTQTSSVQARAMKGKTPPIAFFSPGRVYRKEATDQTHDFLFTQAEGLLINKDVSVSNLLATARTFLQKIFEKDDLNIRVRPGYFPFVEPGLEIDASCPFCTQGCSVCKRTGWIELLGSGLIHPNVLKEGGIDPTIYSGFAFGMGIERIAMIKYGINDIRLFHSSKINFLDQF